MSGYTRAANSRLAEKRHEMLSGDRRAGALDGYFLFASGSSDRHT